MIEVELKYSAVNKQAVIDRFLCLPDELRPTYQSIGENETGISIKNHKNFRDFISKKQSGFFLKGKNVLYDVNINGNLPIGCNCFLDVDPLIARRFLIHMAAARPLFGFACAPEELFQWNLIATKLGVNSIESWVGRDIQKYIPGLYWLTLLPAELAQQHDVPLSLLEDIALDHAEIEPGLHLFRFYNRPEDWRATDHVAKLRSSLPGIFNVERVKPLLPAAKTFLELDDILSQWN